MTQFLLPNTEIRPVLVIRIVAVRNQRVEPVISARELEHDKNLAVRAPLGGKGRSGLPKNGDRKVCTCTYADAVHSRAQQITAGGARKRKAIFHGSPPAKPIDTQAGS